MFILPHSTRLQSQQNTNSSGNEVQQERDTDTVGYPEDDRTSQRFCDYWSCSFRYQLWEVISSTWKRRKSGLLQPRQSEPALSGEGFHHRSEGVGEGPLLTVPAKTTHHYCLISVGAVDPYFYGLGSHTVSPLQLFMTNDDCPTRVWTKHVAH